MATNEEEKVLFHQDNAPYHKPIATMQNYMNCTSNCSHIHPILQIWAPSNYWLFSDLKRMLQGKRFGSNEEVISETEAYFEAKDKPFYKKGIRFLEKRWNQCITLEGDFVDE